MGKALGLEGTKWAGRGTSQGQPAQIIMLEVTVLADTCMDR